MIVRLDCWRLSTPQLEKTKIFLSLLWLVALFIHCVVSKGQSSNPQTQCKWWPWAVVNPKAWIHACYWYGITFEQSHFGWVPLNLAIGLKPVSGVACHHNCPTSHDMGLRCVPHIMHISILVLNAVVFPVSWWMGWTNIKTLTSSLEPLEELDIKMKCLQIVLVNLWHPGFSCFVRRLWSADVML